MPQRVSSKDLAEMLNIGSSASIAHRRKAERRLLAELIGA
jgi:predicted DNA binding protein